ncbi:hypothetical protein F4805DRAFT_450257 [Annulohypoxylon moriforme]|nr:hypothetical protein F4805DRAFT_450257 [Annulohypoxylon moriforme]
MIIIIFYLSFAPPPFFAFSVLLHVGRIYTSLTTTCVLPLLMCVCMYICTYVHVYISR